MELHEILSWFLTLWIVYQILDLLLSLILLVELLLKWVTHLVQPNLLATFQSVLESLLLDAWIVSLELLIELLLALSLVLVLEKLLNLSLISLQTNHGLILLIDILCRSSLSIEATN